VAHRQLCLTVVIHDNLCERNGDLKILSFRSRGYRDVRVSLIGHLRLFLPFFACVARVCHRELAC
jgi:hypothetical protein